ncbi:EexN family lipoprotein [uncultured Campylobacter sp.]|uniref:EexN family lipoprotein n=1 Tax=uncultured Campylobacter sp. TaxID=218934 RepID=UPI002605A2C7|nr:EexN family lipoprotein [uncultured Campylobacter sp.]
MKNTKTLLGALALAALLVGCGDDTEVKTKEYYDAHLDEAKEVLAKCDFNTLKDGSNSYKNCVNAKESVNDIKVMTVEYYEKHIEEAKEVEKNCDWDKIEEGSKMHKNCENASKGLEEYRFNERKKYFTGGQK